MRIESRLLKLEDTQPAQPTRYLWRKAGMTKAQVQEAEAKILAAEPNARIIHIGWMDTFDESELPGAK